MLIRITRVQPEQSLIEHTAAAVADGGECLSKSTAELNDPDLNTLTGRAEEEK